MHDIISIGSATRDVLIGLDGYSMIDSSEFITGRGLCLPFSSKLEIKKIVFTSGGGGTNAAVTFARQGLSTACVGVVGNDLNGQELLDELIKEGVDISCFQKHEDDLTAYSVILVDKTGERTILSYKGEGQHFDVNKIPFDKFKTNWLFLDSLGGHYDLLETAVNWAVKNNIKIATNPGGKELAHGLDKLRQLLNNFAIVIMNQEEASKLMSIPYEEETKIFKVADELIRGIFVMTKGPKGVVVSDGENLYRASVPDSPIIERTGAGDAFSSGFMAEYMRSTMDNRLSTSEAITKAIQFATANASSVVTQYGAKAGILKKDDWGPWPLVEVNISKL